MATNINRVVITGNLTRDPELRSTASGVAVGKLGVAVNNRRKIDGQWGEYTSFFDVTVFGAQAENCANFLSKGRPVAIDGRLEQDRWEAKDGSGNRSRVVIIADSVQFLGSRDGSAGGGGGGFSPQSDVPADTGDFQPAGGPDDDIPF